jgi:hypothetical protein
MTPFLPRVLWISLSDNDVTLCEPTDTYTMAKRVSRDQALRGEMPDRVCYFLADPTNFESSGSNSSSSISLSAGSSRTNTVRVNTEFPQDKS